MMMLSRAKKSETSEESRFQRVVFPDSYMQGVFRLVSWARLGSLKEKENE